MIIPLRKDAVLSSDVGTLPTQGDQHILAIQRDGRFQWERTSGYYAQAQAENAFSRYKRAFGGGLRAKREEAKQGKPHWVVWCSIDCGN